MRFLPLLLLGCHHEDCTCQTTFDVPLGVAVIANANLDLTVTAGSIEDHCAGRTTDGVLQCSTFGISSLEETSYALVGSADLSKPTTVHVTLLIGGGKVLDEDLSLDWGKSEASDDSCPACYAVTAAGS